MVKEINPEYGKYLEKHGKNYLAFLKYPEEIKSHIYPTNIVESINAGLELMRIKHGGYFAVWRMLEINLFVQLANLHDRWMDKLIPSLAGVRYRLRQIFAMKFESANASDIIDLQSVAEIENG